jgi:hypothetical protein
MTEAEDVVQDSFTRGALDELRDDRPLRAWLFRIAHNRARDLLRGRAIRGLPARVMAQSVRRPSCNSELPMAAKGGMTRGAVIGKLRRLGLLGKRQALPLEPRRRAPNMPNRGVVAQVVARRI